MIHTDDGAFYVKKVETIKGLQGNELEIWIRLFRPCRYKEFSDFVISIFSLGLF